MRKHPDFATIPAITENDSEGILSGPDQFPDIVDLILQAMRIAGISRSKIGIADPLAIE
jgi:hypothetical protein